MRNIFYVIAIVLLIIWAIGFLVYSVGAIIHLVLVLAVIVFLVKISSKLQRSNKLERRNP